MTRLNKAALRAAVLIREQLAGGKTSPPSIYVPTYSWESIQRIQRQIATAADRGWTGAVKQLSEHLADYVEDCHRDLGNALSTLKAHSQPAGPASCSAADLYRDILALKREFEEVSIDLDEHVLSVTTDGIMLERLDFGPFRIELDWRKLGSYQPYRCVALQPYPAAKSDEITHPHVQDDQLCEGDGQAAIRSALRSGRIHDFFLLVCRLLHTYAPGRAYVELRNWRASECEDCGSFIDEDNEYRCLRCDALLCSNCATSCDACLDSFCSNCLATCAVCARPVCLSCSILCPKCHRRACEACAKGGLCRKCYDQQHEKDQPHDDDDAECQDARHQPAAVPA